MTRWTHSKFPQTSADILSHDFLNVFNGDGPCVGVDATQGGIPFAPWLSENSIEHSATLDSWRKLYDNCKLGPVSVPDKRPYRTFKQRYERMRSGVKILTPFEVWFGIRAAETPVKFQRVWKIKNTDLVSFKRFEILGQDVGCDIEMHGSC